MLTPGLDAAKREGAADRREVRAARVAALEDLLFHLALNAERDETRIAAAARLHAIYCGQPVARQMVAESVDFSSMTDEQPRAEIDRLSTAPDPMEAARIYQEMVQRD